MTGLCRGGPQTKPKPSATPRSRTEGNEHKEGYAMSDLKLTRERESTQLVPPLPLCGVRSRKGRWQCIRAPHPEGTVHVYGRRLR